MYQGHLEAELLAFLRPDETAAELLARTYVEPLYTGVSLLDNFVSLRPGNVLEVAGAAGTGKTEILVQICATCILPSTFGGLHLGGRAENVLMLDLDCKFDLLRLIQVLHARFGQALSHQRAQGSHAERNAVVQDSLPRLHVVRCHSSFDLLATLAVIKPTITYLAAHGGIRCLLIDNISDFYYLDKVGRPPGGGVSLAPKVDNITRDGAPLTLQRVHSGVTQALRSLVREHRVAVMVTKNLLMPGGRDAERGGDMWSYRDFMLKPWQDLVTHRLVLRAVPSRQQQQHARQAQQEDGGAHIHAMEMQHLAKWIEPAADVVLRFQVAEGGIVLQG